MMINKAGSMTLLVLIMLSIMTVTLLVTMQMLSIRTEIINFSISTEREERLCTALTDIGIMAAEQYLLQNFDHHERELQLEVTIPASLAAGYTGIIVLAVDKPVSVDAQVWQGKKLCRRIKALVSIDPVHKITQVLEWLLITV
jgi:hypothetical protein